MGSAASRGDGAAGWRGEFASWWPELQGGDRSAVSDAWSARGGLWGEPVTVRTQSGPISGVDKRLDADGGLVLRLDSGLEQVVLAGDLEPATAPPEGA